MILIYLVRSSILIPTASSAQRIRLYRMHAPARAAAPCDVPRAWRRVQREGRLQSLLHSAARVVRYVYPSYGGAELVELPFRNPYGADHCFQLVWDDPLNQVSVVSSIDEWRALKVHALLPSAAQCITRTHRHSA